MYRVVTYRVVAYRVVAYWKYEIRLTIFFMLDKQNQEQDLLSIKSGQLDFVI